PRRGVRDRGRPCPFPAAMMSARRIAVMAPALGLAASVREVWLSLGELPPGLVVAVSGGPDSVALPRALAAVRPAPSISLVVAHLNHQLRPDSDADEPFVAR